MNRMRKSSISRKIFLLLMVTFLLLIGINNVVILRENVKREEQKTDESNENLMRKISDVTDLIFSQIEEQMNQTAFSENVMNMMLIPEYDDSERNFQVTQALRSLVQSNAYISSAYLYIPYNDKIFTSSQEIIDLDDFSDRASVEETADAGTSSNRILREMTGSGGETEHQLTLFRNYPSEGTGKMGRLIVNIDMESLYAKIVEGIDAAENRILVTDEESRVVLADDTDFLGKQFRTQVGGEYRDAEGRYTVSQRCSFGGGWTYLLLENAELDTGEAAEIIAQILGISVLFFLLGIVCTRVLAYWIYKPIKNLTDLAKEYFKQAANGNKNEFDFLQTAYTEARDTIDTMGAFIEKIKPDLLGKTLERYLKGEPIEKRETDLIRDAYTDSIFVVCVLEPDHGRDIIMKSGSKSVERAIEKIGVKFRTQFPEGCVYYFSPGGVRMAFILCVKVEDGEGLQEKAVQEVDSLEAGEDFPSTLSYAVSGEETGIEQLRAAYQRTLMRIEEKFYYGNGFHAVEEDEEVPGTPEKNVREVVAPGAKSALESIRKGDVEAVSEAVKEIFGSIYKNGYCTKAEVTEALSDLFKDLHPLAQEKGIDIQTLRGTAVPLEEEAAEQETLEDMERWLVILGMRLAMEIGAADRKKSNKYVGRIERYLNENYSNSELSLSVLADHLGLNTAYLSKTFKEGFGENFVDYLNKKRIEEAKKLLRETKYTVKEISQKSGFNTVQNFMRVFKKLVGTSPGMYREEHLSDEE